MNDRLISEARKPAMTEIQRLIDGVSGHLEEASAEETLRKTATDELAKLLDTTAQAISIPHIAEAKQEAADAYDRAVATIETMQAKPDDPHYKVKKRRVVEAKTLWSGGFIETKEDIEAFLKKLRFQAGSRDRGQGARADQVSAHG